MTYTQRIESIARLLEAAEDCSESRIVSKAMDDLHDIALELDETPRDHSPNSEGAAMELVASFPYPHPDDRDRLRVALYHKSSGGMMGEYIMWTEAREPEHDGFREASRFWGHYYGYIGQDERSTVFKEALIALSKKMASVVGPYKENTKTARLFNTRK